MTTYLQTLLYIYSYSYDIKNISFVKDIQEILGQSNVSEASLYLTVLYNDYDFSGEYQYRDLRIFYTNHLQELGLDLGKQESFTVEKIQPLDYFVFFLEKIFL